MLAFTFTEVQCKVQGLLRHARQYLPGSRVTTAATAARAPQQQQHERVRLAVVGDVHGQWGPADVAALKALRPDAVVWVGDIGNEDVGLVQEIAALDEFEKAVILGNHCAWYSMTARGRQRAATKYTASPRGSSPSSVQPEQQQQEQQQQPVIADRVQQQLDALGPDHLGYGHKALAGTNISVVGGRPFSKGGQDFSSIAEFMSRFGVTSMDDSADKILRVINTQVPPGNVLVLLAHNGPAGLGAAPHSICGCDWLATAGDHGDPDLQTVLDQLQAAGRRVALVLHGHMHHMIKGGGYRQMVHIDPATGTVFLNAATVPRVIPVPHRDGSPTASRHHFLVVELAGGLPTCAADVWVHTAQQSGDSSSSSSSSSISKGPAGTSQQQDFLASTASAMHTVQHSKSKTKTAKQAAAKAAQAEAERRLQLQAPQQLQLSAEQRVPQAVGDFQVHVAEVYEVLRAAQPQGPGVAAAAHAGSDTVGAPAVGGWDFFDAHLGKWVSIAVTGCQAGVPAPAEGAAA